MTFRQLTARATFLKTNSNLLFFSFSCALALYVTGCTLSKNLSECAHASGKRIEYGI